MVVLKKKMILCGLCFLALCTAEYVIAGEEPVLSEETETDIQLDQLGASDLNGSVQDTEPEVVDVASEQEETIEQPADSITDETREHESSDTDTSLADAGESEDKLEPEPESEPDKIDADSALQDTQDEGPKMGIDTIHLPDPQGNWLFKRIWWEKAEKKIENIRQYVDAVFESRPEFFLKRADIDKNVLAPFYLEIGFGQGELKRVVDQLLSHIERARSMPDGLTAQEQKIIDGVLQEEQTLKQIQMNIEGIATASDQLDEDVNVLFGLIKQVRGYDREAWNSFKEIAVVLSDTKARELYYKMHNNAKNITNIQAYIRVEFTKHFNSLETMITEKVAQAQELIESLLEKGFDLREQLDKLEKKAVPCEVVTVEEPVEAIEETGFFDNYIMQPISNLFSYISSSIKSVYGWFFGEESLEEKEELDED